MTVGNEKGKREKACLREATSIRKCTHTAIENNRRSADLQPVTSSKNKQDTTVEKDTSTKATTWKKQALVKLVTKVREEDLDEVQSSNRENENREGKEKRTFTFNATIKQTEKTLPPELEKIQALELVIKETWKEKSLSKPSSLSNALSLEIYSEKIWTNIKIPNREYNETTDPKDDWTHFSQTWIYTMQLMPPSAKPFP